MTPLDHAISSSRKFGGNPRDYIEIHDWFDETKAYTGDFGHRALRHHSLGIFEAEQKFGTTITISTGKKVPVRLIGEQHVIEDLGIIPTVADWLRALGDPTKVQPWMTRGVDKKVVALDESTVSV